MRRGQSLSRIRKKRGLGLDILTVTGLLCLSSLLLVWVGLAVHYIPQMEQNSGVSAPATSSSSIATAEKSTNNPWDGWQPLPYDDVDTTVCQSWRTCFHDRHACPGFCRDSPKDLLVKNDVSISVPDDWVPDVTMLRRMMVRGTDAHGNPWPPPLDQELCEPMTSTGGKQGDINKDLLDAVPIRGMPLVTQDDQSYSPKILCMVYTMENSHATKIRAIRETWAGGCDGFLAFSTKSDPRIPAISIPHQGEESYDNMWQKVRSMLEFVGKHYLEDFDFIFQGGDDLFVMPGNLRNYLKHAVSDPEQDFFAGRRFRQTKNVYFNSGGAGYVISRGTLRKYITDGFNHPLCNPDGETSQEDVQIAQCLNKKFNIGLVDTRDEEGRERFHPFAPGTHYTWEHPEPGERDWYEDYNVEWPVKVGKDCCAPDSVSFHYVKKPAMVRHLHALLYNCDQ
ncbi:galactosyltransferase [Nitzschia inconspicua]|uniref:Galactosyltransferase n=1 Tax=Nitzschia inconspicua TaxID=303405 RepID=A0A9K3L3F9_9STRA|nr:galactosyltransferase [Nitzschia inconspicua]